MKVAIVGAEAVKFTDRSKIVAGELIVKLLQGADMAISGGCHLGGIDIWTEEIAKYLKIPTIIHKPKVLSWERGYKPRNIKIAEDCDVLHNIVVREYPVTYTGMRFSSCYHCGGATDHVKSGGCWTANYARRLGKPAFWYVVSDTNWGLLNEKVES